MVRPPSQRRRRHINKIAVSTALRKHWLPFLLLFLTLISLISTHMALLTGFIFTFLIPGLIFHRFFRLKSYELLVLVPILSVMVSTHLVYYLSILLSYSRETILVSFVILTALYVIVDSRVKDTNHLKNFLKVKEFNLDRLFIFLFIFLISLIVLYRSVWLESQAGIVITGSNWQDTPLHYEIIESINNGNFAPEMPYYSGVMMEYHYFVDFHTAILEKVYGFLPKLLPTLNAI